MTTKAAEASSVQSGSEFCVPVQSFKAPTAENILFSRQKRPKQSRASTKRSAPSETYLVGTQRKWQRVTDGRFRIACGRPSKTAEACCRRQHEHARHVDGSLNLILIQDCIVIVRRHVPKKLIQKHSDMSKRLRQVTELLPPIRESLTSPSVLCKVLTAVVQNIDAGRSRRGS